ncbi:MAG: recombinase family protein [Clostridia bacterium]|nr:recombinase family protein [Clostridia bacterium]
MEEEAKIIRIIYRLCLEGCSANSIAKQLTEAKIPTPSGMSVWHIHTVESILQNEKYYGAALLQKKYCVDYRTKEMRKNRGELPMYYVENGHEPIVTKEIFDAVQERLKTSEGIHVFTHSLSNMLFCSECDSFFGPIPIHSTTYNDLVWKCSNRHLKGYPCRTPYLYEEMLYPIFHEIIVSVLRKNSGVVRDCVSVIKSLRNSKNSITQNDVFDAVTAYDINSKAETRIWRTVIDKVIVHQGHLLEFQMMDGSKMEYRMMVTSPRMNKPTKCAEEDIYNDYISGYRTDFLAQKYGFKLTTIRRIIKDYSK